MDYPNVPPLPLFPTEDMDDTAVQIRCYESKDGTATYTTEYSNNISEYVNWDWTDTDFSDDTLKVRFGATTYFKSDECKTI